MLGFCKLGNANELVATVGFLCVLFGSENARNADVFTHLTGKVEGEGEEATSWQES